MVQFDGRNLQGGGDCVVGQGHRARLSVVVIDQFLHQRLADALGDAADDLALHHRRVDDGADIFSCHIAHDFHMPGLRIDVDHDDMGAAGEAAEFGIVERRYFKARIEFRGNVLGGEIAVLGHLLQRHVLVRSTVWMTLSTMVSSSAGTSIRCAASARIRWRSSCAA